MVSDLKRKYGDRLRRNDRKQSVAALEAGSPMSSKSTAENDGSESPRRRGFHIPGFKRTAEDKGMDTLEQMRTLVRIRPLIHLRHANLTSNYAYTLSPVPLSHLVKGTFLRFFPLFTVRRDTGHLIIHGNVPL